MAIVVLPQFGEITIPSWVNDLESFRRWRFSGVLPEKLKVHFIQGEVWLDYDIEEAFTHNLVKTAVTAVLYQLTQADQSGLVFSDGMLVTNDDAGLSTEPDAMFISYAAIEAGRVKFTASARGSGQATELIGSPDVVIEIVSPSSVDKDTEKLMSQYHDARIPEYWLIDVRTDKVQFDIHRRTARGYSTTRATAGWIKSRVFGKSFRLSRHVKTKKIATFTLDVQ